MRLQQPISLKLPRSSSCHHRPRARSFTFSNADPAEVARFSELAEKWWDVRGPMAALHSMNPVRIRWIADKVTIHYLPVSEAIRLLCQSVICIVTTNR
jgi:2-polyprenyl-3-methyl-5-hydroxy-6-metoxy-1,4-benzoquinol methylase